MRIAQVSPLYERVPPIAYGGTERVVSWLTEELVARGHHVTLFATGDSITSARLVAGAPRPLRAVDDPIAAHVAMIDEVCKRAGDGAFDVIHFHTDYLQFLVLDREAHPALTTLHGRLDLPDHQGVYQRFAHHAFVSISDAQRAPMPWLDWRGTVHHGLPAGEHTPSFAPGAYLAFLGRLSPEKGCEAAIQIARAAGLPLRIAGKIDRRDQAYVDDRLRHQLGGAGVEYVGEIGGRTKDEFLAGARALLFPIDWPEPFGLVMIEAMACGTPVIAYRRGSVPEVIDDGVTGYVVDDAAGAVAAVARAGALDRARVRAVFERRFSVERMTDDYLALYQDVIQEHHGRDPARTGDVGGITPRAAFRASGT